jgi:hypothetical protein
LDLGASPELVSTGLGLMLAAEAGPVERMLDGFRCLSQDVEQACDFGDGKWDHSSASSNRRGHIRYC